MLDNKTIFLTGATGLIGSFLLKLLLQNNCKVYALARDEGNKNAYERVIKAVKFWNDKILDKYYKNLIVVDGDITKHNVGLNSSVVDRLQNEVCEIFHCAALTKFKSTIESLRIVNVEGTRNLFDLCFDWHKRGYTKKINYVSSIYVCGDYTGIFKEDDFEVGQKFHTPYEQSKFETEKLVIEYRDEGLWIDIFRPPALGGESTTGKIMKFEQAIYQALRIWNSEIFDYFPCDEKSHFYMVCIDELCESILKISSNTSVRNQNYHTFNSQGIPLVNIIETASELLRFKKPKLISVSEFITKESNNIKRKIAENIFFTINYHLKVESSRTIAYLKKQGFEFSDINEELLSKLIKYSMQAGFLKRKMAEINE